MSAGKFIEGQKPWKIEGAKFDIAMPCATQNEIDQADAEALVKAGVKYVLEGANMPTETSAISVLHKNNVIFAPGKVRLHTAWDYASMLPVDATGHELAISALQPFTVQTHNIC